MPTSKDHPTEFKSFRFDVKTVDDAGAFEGYLAVFNNVDSGNDRIRKGAFKKTLSENSVFPLLYVHNDMRIPVGDFTGEEDNFGLKIKGQLYLNDAQGLPLQEPRQLHVAMKRKAVNGLSIGYKTIKSDQAGPVRDLLELRLGEGSIVPWPMNDQARISSVKSMACDLNETDILNLIESLKALLTPKPPDPGTKAEGKPPADQSGVDDQAVEDAAKAIAENTRRLSQK